MLAALAVLAAATDARAEIALLRNGRSIEVAGFKVSGDRIVLALPGGGEMELPAAEVTEIRRQPRDVTPAGPPPLEGTPSPSSGPTAAPAEKAVPEAALPSAPAALPSAAPASPAGAGVDRAAEPAREEAPLLPVGGVFDREALRDMATRIARQHGVDASLVHAVIQTESRYDAFAVSPRGAMGLMQLMPKTAARFDVENAFDPVENVDAGVRYLKELLERYSGQRRLALAAYNAGEEAVERYGGIPPYRETINYVGRVLGLARR